MMKRLMCVLSGLWFTAPWVLAQTTDALPTTPAAITLPALTPALNSTLDAELLYQLLVSEISIQRGEPATGFAIVMNAARKTDDAQLYQRAADIALQSRSADAALQAVRAWRRAKPQSRDANSYLLQILVGLNRIKDTLEPIKTEIELAPASEQALVIAALFRTLSQASDKKLASTIVEQALAPHLANPVNASVAWVTVGRMRLAAGETAAALSAANNAQLADPGSDGWAVLAAELMRLKTLEAEALVKTYLIRNTDTASEIRMVYARLLFDAERYAEANEQLQIVVRNKPDSAQAWLILGSLQLESNQLTPAQTSLERYVALANEQPGTAESARSLVQAYLALAQIAEKRKNFAAAESWVGKIPDSQDVVQAQIRRASILASQGRLDEGRQLIQALPGRSADELRLKLIAEVSLLKNLKHYQLAYDLLGKAVGEFQADMELAYDQAMMAEKIGNLGDMERLLRGIITVKPDYYHAYNALGYSFADKNIRLLEARELILKALALAPSNPLIQDSLGWVEFRLGNLTSAIEVFEIAFKAKSDPEIAAHFGEVLWSVGQHSRAMTVWREGQSLNPENETLQETLNRLGVKP